MPRHGYGAPVGRRVDVEQLVGLREVAECLGLPRVQTLHYMRRTDSSFPDPIWTRPTQGGHGAVWYWPEIRRWAVAAGYEVPERAKSASGRRLVDVDHLVPSIDIARYLGYSQAQRVYKCAGTTRTFRRRSSPAATGRGLSGSGPGPRCGAGRGTAGGRSQWTWAGRRQWRCAAVLSSRKNILGLGGSPACGHTSMPAGEQLHVVDASPACTPSPAWFPPASGRGDALGLLSHDLPGRRNLLRPSAATAMLRVADHERGHL